MSELEFGERWPIMEGKMLVRKNDSVLLYQLMHDLREDVKIYSRN